MECFEVEIIHPPSRHRGLIFERAWGYQVDDWDNGKFHEKKKIGYFQKISLEMLQVWNKY